MYRTDYVSAITEDADTLFDLERSHSKPKPRQRVQMLRLLKTGQAETLPGVAILVGLSPNHASVLSRRYRADGLSSLLETQYKGRIPRLNPKQIAEVEKECAKGFRSLYVGQEWIEKHFSTPYSLSGLWRLFERIGVKKNGTAQTL